MENEEDKTDDEECLSQSTAASSVAMPKALREQNLKFEDKTKFRGRAIIQWDTVLDRALQ